MYKIKNPGHDYPFPVKIHYVFDKAVAEEILSDLESRDCDVELVEVPAVDHLTWDPGGMLFMNDENFKFDLGTGVINCRAQHFDMFADMLQEYTVRGTTTPYYKIHSEYFCLGLTADEFENLKAQADNEELQARAQVAWDNREAAIQKVVDAGHLVRATKDAAGNIIDLDKMVARNNKDLN